MALPLGELPGDLLHDALRTIREEASDQESAVAAERRLRDAYDESRGRLGLMTRLVMRLGKNAPRALDVGHAGLSLFATALAMASGQRRDLTVLSFSRRQSARLALAMRAAGLKQPAVEAQFLYLLPDVALPEGFDRLVAGRAAALLATADG
jgi:hypothetical protein